MLLFIVDLYDISCGRADASSTPSLAIDIGVGKFYLKCFSHSALLLQSKAHLYVYTHRVLWHFIARTLSLMRAFASHLCATDRKRRNRKRINDENV